MAFVSSIANRVENFNRFCLYFRYFFRKFSKFFSVESRLTNKTQLVAGFELRQVVCAVDYGRSVIAPTVCRYHLGMVRRAYYHYMKPVGIMLTHNVVNFDDERAGGVHDAVSLFDYSLVRRLIRAVRANDYAASLALFKRGQLVYGLDNFQPFFRKPVYDGFVVHDITEQITVIRARTPRRGLYRLAHAETKARFTCRYNL